MAACEQQGKLYVNFYFLYGVVFQTWMVVILDGR